MKLKLQSVIGTGFHNSKNVVKSELELVLKAALILTYALGTCRTVVHELSVLAICSPGRWQQAKTQSRVLTICILFIHMTGSPLGLTG